MPSHPFLKKQKFLPSIQFDLNFDFRFYLKKVESLFLFRTYFRLSNTKIIEEVNCFYSGGKTEKLPKNLKSFKI